MLEQLERPAPVGALAQAPLILHAFSTFRVGGPQVRFADIVRHLGGRCRHLVVAMDGGYDCAEKVDAGAPVAYVRTFTKPSSLAGSLAAFRRFLRIHKPDLLVTYNWGAIEWALANRLFPICPHVHIEDGFGPEEATGQLRRRVWTRRLAVGAGTRLVVPSLTLRRLALEVWRIPASRVVYIPNGIDTGRFRPASLAQAREARARLGLPHDRPVVGTVAALRAEKNLSRLIRAFALVRRQRDCHLAIAGEGPERGRLEALARELSVADAVAFLGHAAAPESIYPAFDVFALSSDTEQMPYSVLEAMACALPIAGVEVGDVAEMVAAANRPFIVAADADLLGRALLHVLGQGASVSTLGEANRAEAVARYDLAAMCSGYVELSGSMITASQRPSRIGAASDPLHRCRPGVRRVR